MTPRVFTLRTAEPKDWKEALAGIWQNKWKLQLYCEAPGCWHPPGVDLGLYDVNITKQFFRGDVGKWIKRMVGVLKYTAPLVGPTIAHAYEDINQLIKNDVKLMSELVKKFPEFTKDGDIIGAVTADNEFRHKIPNEYRGESLMPLRQLLLSLDPDLELGKMGGLTKTLTPEGHYLWLCDEHRKEVML